MCRPEKAGVSCNTNMWQNLRNKHEQHFSREKKSVMFSGRLVSVCQRHCARRRDYSLQKSLNTQKGDYMTQLSIASQGLHGYSIRVMYFGVVLQITKVKSV